MKRSVEILGGGVLGLVLGTVFLTPAVISAFAPAIRAIWSVTGCRPGTYMLSSNAQLVGGGPKHTVTTAVRVPQADVVQLFTDLPPGQYMVSAILVAANGSIAGRGTQTLMAEEGAAAILRSRLPEQELKGRAGQRTAATSKTSMASTSANTTVAAPSTSTGSTRIAAPARAAPRGGLVEAAMPRDWQIADLIQMIDPAGAESGWHRIALVDLDEDGLADEIRIESPSGATIVWRLVRQELRER